MGPMIFSFSKCKSKSDEEEKIRAFVANTLEGKICFSQVREDPVVDERAIAKHFGGRSNIRMAMVASGGDTCAYLLGTKEFALSKMFVVDPNPAQLGLTRIKLHLLRESREDRLALLGHTEMNAEKRKERVEAVMGRLGIDRALFGRLHGMSLDESGRYERLFALFREQLRECREDIEGLFRARSVEEQRRILAREHVCKAVERAFACVMDIGILRALFGECATQNRVLEFATHFFQRTMHYLENNLASESPFAAKLLLGRFYGSVVYSWMELPQMDYDRDSVVFVEGRLDELLEKEKDLDVVHVSNVPDWLSTEDADVFFRTVQGSLREGGIVIVRILNSTVNPQLAGGIEWMEELSQKLHGVDRSFFYRSVLVGRKPARGAVALADEVLRESRLFSSCFFEDVRRDRVRLCDFREMQKVFFFAVSYFSRPMAALVSRIDDQSKRMLVLENIIEEHGHGSYEKSHECTFLSFLESIDCQVDIAEPPEVRMFNVGLMGVCTCEDVRTAVGCLGIIEYAFSTISQIIGSHVSKKGWAKRGALHHYTVHSVLDIQHSADLFSIVDMSQCAEDMQRFRKGLELGACMFRTLYESIYKPL